VLLKDEYSILNSKHFIGIHGYVIVYSVASKQSFEMARVIRDKILNHLVNTAPPQQYAQSALHSRPHAEILTTRNTRPSNGCPL